MDLSPLDRGFETPRFVLAPLAASHLQALSAVHGDDAVTRFLPSPTWRTADDATNWLARHEAMHADGVARRWAVVDRADGRPIGDCMLFRFDASAARAELGFVLGRADQGRGVMREAVGALLSAAFDDLALRRVEAFADPRNAASHALLLALGFVCEGTLRQRAVIKGEVCDANAYGLLRDEWAVVRGRREAQDDATPDRPQAVTVGGSDGPR